MELKVKLAAGRDPTFLGVDLGVSQKHRCLLAKSSLLIEADMQEAGGLIVKYFLALKMKKIHSFLTS